MAWRLRPWHGNLGKREVKAPKVYLADSGLLHSLLGIADQDALLAHPKCGASWEGFAIREILHHLRIRPRDAWFWGLHSGAELDLLIDHGGKRYGFEIKLTRSPQVTPSMRSAITALELAHLYVVCHGEGPPWFLAEKVGALPLGAIKELPCGL